ncbi:YheU family protein [Vibrio sp. D431a]|uniref:YheU family protein n=1 Tax=Vibrio sp. D431a TaxID=2837388 RepID=UPI002552A3CB|nr:YheU family protein [Vibrio sp. D431a]
MFIINPKDLTDEALTGLARNYVHLQQGSDQDETPFDERVNFAINAIKTGLLSITYSELHEEAMVIETKAIKSGGRQL